MSRSSFAISSLFVVLLALSAGLLVDPLNRLNLRLALLNLGSGWENGLWSLSSLPPSARPEDVALSYPGLGTASILELGRVWAGRDQTYAALVAPGGPRKGKNQIIVFRRSASGWGLRKYEP